MWAGVKINALIILPITTTIFVIFTLKTEAKHKLTDIRRHIPFSVERKASTMLQEIIGKYAREEISHPEFLEEVERLSIKYKYQKSGRTILQTARAMKIPRSTLYSKARRLGIKINDVKDSKT